MHPNPQTIECAGMRMGLIILQPLQQEIAGVAKGSAYFLSRQRLGEHQLRERSILEVSTMGPREERRKIYDSASRIFSCVELLFPDSSPGG